MQPEYRKSTTEEMLFSLHPGRVRDYVLLDTWTRRLTHGRLPAGGWTSSTHQGGPVPHGVSAILLVARKRKTHPGPCEEPKNESYPRNLTTYHREVASHAPGYGLSPISLPNGVEGGGGPHGEADVDEVGNLAGLGIDLDGGPAELCGHVDRLGHV